MVIFSGRIERMHNVKSCYAHFYHNITQLSHDIVWAMANNDQMSNLIGCYNL